LLIPVGGVLLQKGDDGELQPIAFVSCKLSDTAQRWVLVLWIGNEKVYDLQSAAELIPTLKLNLPDYQNNNLKISLK